MGIIFVILFGCFGILFSARYAYWAWFQSEKYLGMAQKRRREYRKNQWFLPQAITFDFLDKNPKFEIWSIRITSLFIILLCFFWMIAAIHGPFDVK